MVKQENLIKRIKRLKMNIKTVERIMDLQRKEINSEKFKTTIESKANGELINPVSRSYVENSVKYSTLIKQLTEIEEKLKPDEVIDETEQLLKNL
jgi:hypothetical protein